MRMDPTAQRYACRTFRYRPFRAALFCRVGFTEPEDTTRDTNPPSWGPHFGSFGPHLFATRGCEDLEHPMSPWVGGPGIQRSLSSNPSPWRERPTLAAPRGGLKYTLLGSVHSSSSADVLIFSGVVQLISLGYN